MWILRDVRFKEWYSAPASKRLLLHGSMGCGKTVTATCIIDEVIRLNSHQVPRPFTCYHYCKTDGAGNSVDIFSSLILQVLDQKGDSLKKRFCEWHKSKKDDLRLDPTQSSKELSAFLQGSVDALERPLYVILDGLDECMSDTLDDLIDFIEVFSEMTPPVKFCLTSRHTDGKMRILKRSSCCVQMIPDARRDETIVHHMVKRILRTLDEHVQSEIIRELAARANGSAIWTKTSIDLIKRHDFYDNEALIDFLKGQICYTELPGLYAKLFSHVTKESGTNERFLTEALEILAVAKRPLLVQELNWAVAMQLSPAGRKRVLAELEKSAKKSPVMSLLQPFIVCISDEDPAKSYVRLAHESIRELILESSPSKWEHLSNKLKSTNTEYASRPIELEANILALCVEYLMLDEIDQKDLFSEDETDVSHFPFYGFPLNDTNLDDTDPIYYDPLVRGFGGFFAYSSCFWMEHFRHVTAESSCPPISTIVKLTDAKSKRFHNWYQQSCRPDCTVRATCDERIDRLNPLVVISLYGPDAMLKELPGILETDTGLFTSESVKIAIEIVLNRDPLKLKRLLEHSQLDDFKILALSQMIDNWSVGNALAGKDKQKWDECFDLVLPSPDQLIQFNSGNELLCDAVCHRCLPVVKKLFQAAESSPALRDELLCDRLRSEYHPKSHPSPFDHQSVGIAVYHGDLEMLRLLTQSDGD